MADNYQTFESAWHALTDDERARFVDDHVEELIRFDLNERLEALMPSSIYYDPAGDADEREALDGVPVRIAGMVATRKT
jgi:hypothetical protein